MKHKSLVCRILTQVRPRRIKQCLDDTKAGLPVPCAFGSLVEEAPEAEESLSGDCRG
jgi:hypothetical protein